MSRSVEPPCSLPGDVLRAVKNVIGDSVAPIALHEPEFAGREWDYLKDCLDTGWVSSVGSYVDRFEKELAEFTGARAAVATMNGTAALHTCLILAGVMPGDEVLMPSLTFIATANAVSYAGATPHFVDSEDQSLGIDASKLEAHLREVATVDATGCRNRHTGARLSSLVVMHVFGHPCDIDSLAEVAARWKLVLVEDAAESLGSEYRGRHTGNFGRVAALSFNGNKTITTGGGGAILTNDGALARRARHLTTTARVAHRWSFVHDEIGFNYRLPNLNAALGCAQLERLRDMLERKRRLARDYGEQFRPVAGVRFLFEPAGTRSNYWLNAIILDRPSVTDRDAVLATLNDARYSARPLWTLMHRLPMFQQAPRSDLSVAERLEASVINLPSSARLARQ